MLKVIIADDEERVCRLIQALVDWEGLGMEVAGIAHNGLEAVELVRKIRPDILITDIRMPGCSGLELIEQVKKRVEKLEILIISGHAQFEYAQSAIKFGVGDYLLKPIDKEVLHATLLKLKERAGAGEASLEDQRQIFRKNENDIRRIQEGLLDRLIEQRETKLSEEILKESYYLQVRPGIFQAFWLKVDCDLEEIGQAGLSVVMEKARSLFENSLRSRCFELAFCLRGCSCVGIINYDRKKQEEIRRILKDCLHQLEAQKGLFGPVTFSLAAGSGEEETKHLGRSVREASVIIQERLVKGTGRLLDHMPGESAIHEQNLMEKYLRRITAAIEVMSGEEADAAAAWVWEAACGVRDVHGYELLELAHSCGGLFLSQMEVKAHVEELRRFDELCGQCRNGQELAAALTGFQRKYMEELRQRHENDSMRPIRLAKQYIQNHFSEQITLEEVSGVAGLSTAYFSALFKKGEGEGFARYLIGVRMEQAKLLLRETNSPVAEICKKVGYNDLKHFTRTFEKTAGVKPATYRKLYG